MSQSFLTPRVAIECIDEALVLTRRNFWPLLRVGLIPYLLHAVASLLNGGEPFGRLLGQIAAYGLYGLMEAATVTGAWDLLHGQSIRMGVIWGRVGHRFFSVLIAAWLRILLIFVGVLLIIVPGFYFMAIYFAVPFVNVTEDLGVGDSLSRSRSLAMGSVGGILVSLVGFWVIIAAVAIAIPRLLTQLGVSPFSVIHTASTLVWGAFVIPFRAALAARVYLEIRIRKEGYDLQQVMASLPNAA